jgi:hypothetical protein
MSSQQGGAAGGAGAGPEQPASPEAGARQDDVVDADYREVKGG